MATTSLTGNVYIDGILWGGNHWDSNPITYSFWSDASLDDSYDDYDLIDTEWFGYEIEAMQLALETWSNVADINFIKTADDANNADLGFILVNDFELDHNLGGFNPPETFGEGIGYFNWQGTGWNSAGLQQGGYGFVTLLHELGHGLGLAHPHDDGGGSSIFHSVYDSEDTGDYGINQGIWTTMSYNDGLEDNDLFDGSEYGYQGTPMALDIAAIQHLYGANMAYNTGNDTYVLPTDNASGTFYSSIWDAGGYDAISAATAAADATINLNEAPLVGASAGGYISSVEGVYGGFTIANGVDIEQAIGGFGNDTIIGNEVGNSLTGGAGNDYIDGWIGNDNIYAGPGNDTLYGYTGDDSINGWTGNDTIYGESGNDTLIGGAGSDTLNGYGGGSGEVDTLTGDASGAQTAQQSFGDGGDLFVLGDVYNAYYLGSGYATVTDFYWVEGDLFQVHGGMADYSLGFQNLSGGSASDTLVYYQNDLISVVQDTTNVLLAEDFVFV
ncbi:MAG: M10 family metallopeptidase [Elainellaceae cyanobacterium]